MDHLKMTIRMAENFSQLFYNYFLLETRKENQGVFCRFFLLKYNYLSFLNNELVAVDEVVRKR